MILDVALGWNPDSCLITAFTNALSNPFFALYCSIKLSISFVFEETCGTADK